MLELSRTVRFCLNDGPFAPPEPRHGCSAWPAMRGLGRFYQLTVVCRGQADPVTGYFINIRLIDQAVRAHVLPHLHHALHAHADASTIAMGTLMTQILDLLQPPLNHTVAAVRLELTPFHSLAIGSHDMSHLTLRQQFEFCAAHRLHAPSLSDRDNREIFGKCNNPSGHGHNYQLEVAVSAPVDEHGQVVAVETLDAIVDRAVLQKLDHKHLNIDVPRFRDLNPSVENIAAVVYEMLAPELAEEGLELEEVKLWETSKTACVYRGPDQDRRAPGHASPRPPRETRRPRR